MGSSSTVLEAPAFVAGFDDFAVVRQAVEERRGHLGVAEDTRPVAEGEIGGHDDGGFLRDADQVEQQPPTRLGERQVAKLVQNDQVEPDQMLGGASLTAGPGLGFAG